MTDENRTNDNPSPEPKGYMSMSSAGRPSVGSDVSPKNGPVPVGDKSSPLDEQLVAYLDGELDVEGGRRIETMLASDANVRRRLQEMQRTWDMLDDLDAVPVGSGFTQSTLEMVAVAAGEDLQQSMAAAPRRRRRRLWAIGGSLLAAVAVGFLAVMLAMPDANRQLLDDLPLLMNLDDYRQIDDIKFLELLRDQTPFGSDTTETALSVEAVEGETLAQRRQRVESMSDGEKERLARLHDRWASLPAEEKQHVRELHSEIVRSADSAQLLHVMHRYCQWLQTMPSYRWSDLAGLDPEAQLKSVKKWLENDPRRLTEKESKELLPWMDKVAARHEAQFVAMLPPERRKGIEHLSQDDRRRMMRAMLRHLQPGGPGPGLVLNSDDLIELRQRLSPETAAWLGQKTEAEQRRIAAGWIVRQVARPRATRGPLNPSDELLANFFETLNAQERDRLLVLPGEEMQRELLQMYFRHARPAGGPPRGVDASAFGDRSGPRRGPANRTPKRGGDPLDPVDK